MQRRNELRERQTLAMEETLPVSLQYLYGGSAMVLKGEQEEDEVIEGCLVGRGGGGKCQRACVSLCDI